MLSTKFRFISPSGFREDFFKSAKQKQELPMVAMFVNRSELNEPLKLLGQMNRNLVGSIYIMSSIKIAHVVPIH
jgi:hypothetical protein